MTLTLKIDLPDDIERKLREETPDLDADAREAYLVDLYRRDRLTHFQLAQALNLDRFETDGILKKHNVMIELSAEDFCAECADLRHIVHG